MAPAGRKPVPVREQMIGRVTIAMMPADRVALDRVVARSGKTKSAFVRDLLEQYLKAERRSEYVRRQMEDMDQGGGGDPCSG